ncbi:CinA family protein [Rhizosaccharibacter radicis]|uniref:Nicotinamide-nucleotide amidohydrolase family protein n=1 Tax=Rhizosaccharibacter radicis TaxID=2782605 RepID=A0ABT1VV82_9PROT|nr:nicotinamide-nucleotide amidohydrolase family protein [Acetobacteraceae bacterium KSS12]
MIGQETLRQADALVPLLRDAGLRVVTAESCTSGLLAACLTHPPGSSPVVLGGFVTYSREMKRRHLGVPADILERFGAISAETAAAMADGALTAAGADLALSITGLAGPDGDEGKPVGLVWFGLAHAGHPTRTVSRHLPGDRDAVRESAVREALRLLRQVLPD